MQKLRSHLGIILYIQAASLKLSPLVLHQLMCQDSLPSRKAISSEPYIHLCILLQVSPDSLRFSAIRGAFLIFSRICFCVLFEPSNGQRTVIITNDNKRLSIVIRSTITILNDQRTTAK